VLQPALACEFLVGHVVVFGHRPGQQVADETDGHQAGLTREQERFSRV
jgi:hypothetical protein